MSLDVPAIATGIALGAVGLYLQWGRALRLPPELGLLLAGSVAWQLDLLPSAAGMADLWAEVLLEPEHARLLALATVGALVSVRDPATGGRTGIAALGGFLVGALPTSLLVVPGAASPREGARLALLATATSAASPFGGPGPQLLGDATIAYTLWALVPAALAALVCWPGGDPRPARPTAFGFALAAGLVASFLLGPFSGLQVALILGLVTMLLPARDDDLEPPTLRSAWLPLRHALVAVFVVALARLGGALLHAGDAAAYYLDESTAAPLAVGAAWLAGAIADPWLLALFADRALDLGSAPQGLSSALALGFGLAPGVSVAVVVAWHGWRSLRFVLPVALLQLGIAVAWAALVPAP